ncbi:MAG TPA: outer membrane beta-barrel protein [Allosphingosinicella sp.]|jgi:outer membrane immunogenic protein
MLRYALTAALAAAAFASPAAAQTFTGPRVSGHIGLADESVFGTDVVTFGGQVGFDHQSEGGAVVGLTGEYQNSEDTGRDLSLTFRGGGLAAPNVLVYGMGGYTNLGVGSGTGVTLNGFRLGVGAEVALGTNAFVTVEQRYSNYELGVDGWQSVAGIGFRF